MAGAERVGGDSVAQAGELRSARIESLRALAALGVFAGHAYGAAYPYGGAVGYPERVLFGGGVGVFLFFALSGYLLFLPFAKRDLAEGSRIDLRQYARNRVLRILPLYYAVMIAILLIQEQGATVKEWLLFSTFSENLSPDTLGSVNGVFWSLVVELHFYLLLPLIALLVARLGRGSIGRAAVVLGGLGGASLLLRYLTLYSDPTRLRPLLYSLPETFVFFVVGMLLVLLRLHWQRRPPSWLRGPLNMSTAWIVAAAVFYLALVGELERDWLAAFLSFLLLGACVLPLRQGSLVRVLEWKPLAAVGVASYSLYLWHPPLLRIVDGIPGLVGNVPALLAIAAPVCLGAAFLSYAVVEAPFLRLRRRWGATAATAGPSAAYPPATAGRIVTSPPT